MTTPRWSSFLAPKSVAFSQAAPSASGGMSATGYEQVVVSTAGRWQATLVFHISPARVFGLGVLFWRFFVAYVQGRANSFVVPVFDKGQTPAVLAGNALGPISHSDGSGFSDGSHYYQPSTPAQVVGAVAVGAITLTMDMIAGHSPQPGQYFSVCDRLYLISAAVAPASGNNWSLTFWPPVREAIADGATADFDRPACLMRLAKDDSAALTLTPGYRGDATVNFVEAPVS